MRKEKQMDKFTVILTVVAAMLSAEVKAADAFLLPTSNILWHTAPSSDFDVPVVLPRGATSAKLAVDGKGYSRTDPEGIESVGTDPVCDAENLRRIGDVFERYGSFGEEDALVGVGGC